MAELIGPEGLEADAVVPQCLDNQYVSDDVFADMIRRGVDFRNQAIAQAREKNFRNEFIRSLVYSSQVVIQRAFFKNSDFLHRNYRPESGRDLVSFAQLMRDRAIVPFLLEESSLGDDRQYAITAQGNLATRLLLEEVGDDLTCVRLAVEDSVNSRATSSMISAFGNGLLKVRNFDDEQFNAMAAELFSNPTVLQEEGTFDAARRAFDEFSLYVFQKMGERRGSGKIARQNIYEDLLMAGDSPDARHDNVALGRFKAPSADAPYPLELKKFVDLVYNSNLPDHLGRYTFTPTGLPTRMALQDAPGIGYRHDSINGIIADREFQDWVRRTFMARMNQGMSLPLLSDLTVSDVVEIRKLDEWQPFKDAQTQILKEPLRFPELMPKFQSAFDQFQRALSDWYNRTYKRDQTVDRYVNFISLALSIGGSLILAGQHTGSVSHELISHAIPLSVNAIPRRVKGYAATLLVGVYDIGKRRLDAERSYTVELMQTQTELAGDAVRDLLESVTVKSLDSAMPVAAPDSMAEKGVK